MSITARPRSCAHSPASTATASRRRSGAASRSTSASLTSRERARQRGDLVHRRPGTRALPAQRPGRSRRRAAAAARRRRRRGDPSADARAPRDRRAPRAARARRRAQQGRHRRRRDRRVRRARARRAPGWHPFLRRADLSGLGPDRARESRRCAPPSKTPRGIWRRRSAKAIPSACRWTGPSSSRARASS